MQYLGDATIRNLKNESPLDLSSRYGRFDTAQLLLRKNPGLLNNVTEDCCPLHLAARHGHIEVVQLLLDLGADINQKVKRL